MGLAMGFLNNIFIYNKGESRFNKLTKIKRDG